MMAFAKIVSRIFEPLLVLFLFLSIAGVRAGAPMVFFIYIALFFLFIVGVRLWMMHAWKLDWDLSERQKRIRPLLLVFGIVIANVFVVRALSNVELLGFFYLLILWLLGFFLITLKFKISGHVGIVTLVGLSWHPLLFIVPLVAWSRIVLKKHTTKEVIIGFFYSLIIYEIWKSIF